MPHSAPRPWRRPEEAQVLLEGITSSRPRRGFSAPPKLRPQTLRPASVLAQFRLRPPPRPKYLPRFSHLSSGSACRRPHPFGGHGDPASL